MQNYDDETLFRKRCYELYQLDWMMSHGYSISDIFEILRDSYCQCCEDGDIDGETGCDDDFDLLEDQFEERGFNGELFAGEDEFYACEYQDPEYMTYLLPEDMQAQYFGFQGIKNGTDHQNETIRIEDVIAYVREVAEKNRRAVDFESEDKIDEDMKTSCLHCTEAHEQLTKWLEELEIYRSLAPRELVSEKQKPDRDAEYQKGFHDGYSSAVDDFTKRLHYEEFDNAYGTNIVLTPKQVDEFAKQLKAEKK